MTDTPPNTDVGSLAAATAAAVTGPQTPDNVSVKQPAKQVLAAVFAALALVLIGVAAVIGVLAYGPWWKDSEIVALARIKGLSWIAWLLCADVVLLVGAIAIPGGLGRVEASAGNNKISLN